MGPEEYEELKRMHGIIRIQYDQEKMANDCNTFEQAPILVEPGKERGFPFFLQSMKVVSFPTLAPIMRGEEYFITPQVRMGYYHGVRNHIFDCTFCERTCEPYNKTTWDILNRRRMLRMHAWQQRKMF